LWSCLLRHLFVFWCVSKERTAFIFRFEGWGPRQFESALARVQHGVVSRKTTQCEITFCVPGSEKHPYWSGRYPSCR
jgi:hypothetical protein